MARRKNLQDTQGSPVINVGPVYKMVNVRPWDPYAAPIQVLVEPDSAPEPEPTPSVPEVSAE